MRDVAKKNMLTVGFSLLVMLLFSLWLNGGVSEVMFLYGIWRYYESCTCIPSDEFVIFHMF